MSDIRVSSQATKIVNNSIFLTGSARSGTSILGTLLHSLLDTEFAYEPPFLSILMPLINEMDKEQWSLLFESYLFEELLVPMIAGRRLNYNKKDTRSSAWSALTEEEVLTKITTSWNRKKILSKVCENTLIFSMPNALPWISTLQQNYKTRVIIMVRKPESVLASINTLGWYEKDEIIEDEPRFFPLKSNIKFNIPSWVPDEKEDDFLYMSSLERAIFQYTYLYQKALSIQDGLFIDYDKMLLSPESYFKKVTSKLKLDYGPKTEEILNSFKEPVKDRTINFTGIDLALLDSMYGLHEKCLDRCFYK